MKKTSDKTSRLSTRSQSWDSVKPASVFELFELVGVLRVRPRLSEKCSKGKFNVGQEASSKQSACTFMQIMQTAEQG